MPRGTSHTPARRWLIVTAVMLPHDANHSVVSIMGQAVCVLDIIRLILLGNGNGNII
ncbi:hypothetical protein [Shewanella colwelliana]|uniref:hypothetical protein n=1 Tax=Shewanella colwelliana TaxID=23 RepID=UPI0004B6EB71|nr:hypothetical protein [Shewanella colwelliana]MDX1280929.1 hypothetical protein [Shewanella colwelliana]